MCLDSVYSSSRARSEGNELFFLGSYINRDICNRSIESTFQNVWYQHNCLNV